MSDNSQLDEIQKGMEEAVAIEKLRQDTLAKKALLDNKRINSQFNELNQNQKDMDIAKSSNYGALTNDQILALQNANDDYITAARNGMEFIIGRFKKVVPFFRKNFILVGAKTGEGKSTAVANIAFSVITHTNPDGSTRKALVLTNEERAEDFYNRITCLIKGWHYTNHDKFTQEQVDTFRKFIPILASNGRLTVVDNNHNGSHGVTTTIEGIENVFESLLANKQYYDVVIIDYYQNIISSKTDPSASENDVQAKLARMLDKYKNLYPAPIVMMAQITPQDKDGKMPFQQRIKGRKMIMDPATLVIEMTADRKNLRTKWTVWKSRFTEAVGSEFFTGYEYGKFVEYTDDFAAKVMRLAIDKNNGIKDAFKKDGKDGK